MQKERRLHVEQTISDEDRSFEYATGNNKSLDEDDEHNYLNKNSKTQVRKCEGGP